MHQHTSTIPRTYAQSTTFPNRNQAIIIHAADNIKLQEYVYTVGTHVGPENIIFSSRISNNRICIYLKSGKLADNFSSFHPTLNINDHVLKVRKLINPSKRLLLSNVSPHIPHSEIENILINQLKLKPTSPMSFLRAGLPNDQYKHVLSFRRQIYIIPDSQEEEAGDLNIPESITINYEEEEFRIYLSTNDQWCSICKTSDHNTGNCTKTTHHAPYPTQTIADNITPLTTNTAIDEIEVDQDTLLHHLEDNNNTEDFVEQTEVPPKQSSPKGSKRNLSENTSPVQNLTISTKAATHTSPNPPSTKKTKTINEYPPLPTTNQTKSTTVSKNKSENNNQPCTIAQVFAPLKNTIIQQNKAIPNSLTLTQLVKLVETSKLTTTAEEAIKSLQIADPNPSIISIQLQSIYENITDRSTKIRITKLLDKISTENASKPPSTMEP